MLLTEKLDMENGETKASLLLEKLSKQKQMRESAAWIITGLGKMNQIDTMKANAR
jgi:hypothetical protein